MTNDNRDALKEATNLATSLWEKHYKSSSPDWKPLDDLCGLLSQIDNMICGLVSQHDNDKQDALAGLRLIDEKECSIKAWDLICNAISFLEAE